MGVWEMLALGQHDAAADGAARGGTVQPWRVGFPLSTGTVTQVPISLCLEHRECKLSSQREYELGTQLLPWTKVAPHQLLAP